MSKPKMPRILRTTTRKSNSFELVGGCYLLGFLRGDDNFHSEALAD